MCARSRTCLQCASDCVRKVASSSSVSAAECSAMPCASAKRGSSSSSGCPTACASPGQCGGEATSMHQRPSEDLEGVISGFVGACGLCRPYDSPPASAPATKVPAAHTPAASSEVPTLVPFP